jgi:hypothetical protein
MVLKWIVIQPKIFSKKGLGEKVIQPKQLEDFFRNGGCLALSRRPKRGPER